jgi:hypothetical protein
VIIFCYPRVSGDNVHENCCQGVQRHPLTYVGMSCHTGAKAICRGKVTSLKRQTGYKMDRLTDIQAHLMGIQAHLSDGLSDGP